MDRCINGLFGIFDRWIDELLDRLDRWIVRSTIIMIYMYIRVMEAKYTHCKMITEPNFTEEEKKEKREILHLYKYFSAHYRIFAKSFDPN